MKHNEATAAIRAINPAIFEGLHIKVGFDFEAPITIKRISAPFTIKKAWKAVEPSNPYTSTAAIIMRDSSVSPSHYMHDFRLITITADSIDEYEKMSYHKYDRQHRYNMVFNDFCRKGDFNDLRKLDTCEAFIIVQHDNFIQKPAEKKTDWTQRQRDMNPGEHEQRTQFYYNKRPTIIIDKSNYRVDMKRDDLKRRAAKLRSEREKAAADAATESTANVKYCELITALYHANQRIIKALTAIDFENVTADTVNTFKAIAASIGEYSYLRGISAATNSIIDFERSAKEKKFTSPDRYNAAYNNILDTLNAIMPEV